MSNNDWMMPPQLFDWLSNRLAPWDVVVELGSGDGTKTLARYCRKVVTFEHDPRYLMPLEDKIDSVYAPLVDGWYDAEKVAASLPSNYRCVIVDGPPARDGGRSGLLANLDLFADVPFVFDDCHRPEEQAIVAEFARRRSKHASVHHLNTGRSFATVGWEAL